jgi:RNA polymerase sigma factor (sigma-70 family)
MHGAGSVAELYRKHAPALHRRCLGIVGNPDDARDLVQETFARYLAAGARFADATPFAVLYRIATNASIDRLRRKKKGVIPSLSFQKSGINAEQPAEQSILEVAEEAGVTIPFECRSGICGQCKTRLVSGKVRMEVQDALTQQDRAKGLILACQAHATRDCVIDA